MKKKQPAGLVVHSLCQIMRETRIENIKPPAAVSKAMNTQKKNVAPEPEKLKTKLPQWVQPLLKQNASPAEIVKAVIQRGLQRGDRASLIEVETVLNEFGRNRESAAHVVHALSTATLKKLKKIK